MSFRKDTLIIANWKMNPQTTEEAKKIASFSDEKGVVICPPFVFLRQVKDVVKKAELGAQNCFLGNPATGGGAITGEISPKMLKKTGCGYVIVGHSERRNLFQEDDVLVAKKTEMVLKEGLTPIVCIGEKDAGDVEQIKEQINKGLKNIPLKKIIIAYEPVFAIGTGDPCDVDEAEKKKVFIKSILAKIYKNGEETPILYGGSVNRKNALLYVKKASFQGVLVGGASLKAKEFKEIVKSIF